jgi:hypothetical protein
MDALGCHQGSGHAHDNLILEVTFQPIEVFSVAIIDLKSLQMLPLINTIGRRINQRHAYLLGQQAIFANK